MNITNHNNLRMIERGITTQMINNAINNGQITESQRGQGQAEFYARMKDLIIAFDKVENNEILIVTAMWVKYSYPWWEMDKSHKAITEKNQLINQYGSLQNARAKRTKIDFRAITGTKIIQL